MQKIKKEDRVIVIAGRDKGKTGDIKKVLVDGRVVVTGINMVKRHTKANPGANVSGGIVQKEAPLHISNVAIFNAETEKADRIGFRTTEGNKKVRYYRSTGKTLG